MRRGSFLFLICVLSLVFMTGCHRQGGSYDDTPEPVRYEWGLPIDSFRVDTGVVKNGETLGGILGRMGATRQQLAAVGQMPRSEFDVRSIRPDKMYYGLFQTDTAGVEHLCYWVYIASERDTKVLHLTDSVHVEHQQKPIRYESRSAVVGIESSLWNDMKRNDLPTDLALELSEIYAWTIDFFGLQKGDSVRVYFDEMYIDDNSIGIGQIYAANFYHARKWQEAFYFEAGPLHTYFDGDGKSLRKSFLKAPLNYKRISSHFSYARKHPVYKIVRPHTGVDYAAPTGTPVVSIGDGVVIEKAYKGQAGNMVKIKHNATYTTAYLHLSKYGNITVGSHVNQGQVIGYVGATGAATGPHLDFRVWKNGTPIDPLKLESPPAEPVPNKYRAEFDSVVNVLRTKL